MEQRNKINEMMQTNLLNHKARMDKMRAYAKETETMVNPRDFEIMEEN